jgi:predicted AlkP superfamily phosphohydrolase/phosphomutase
MNTDEVKLDWSEENITIEYQDGKYYLNLYARDSETGGWDVVRTDEHRSMFDALKGAVQWVEVEREQERKFDAMYEEHQRWLELQDPTED